MSANPWIAPNDNDPGLTLDELSRACAVSAEWIGERVQAGLLAPRPDARAPHALWRFDATLLVRVRVMRRIERDFDAVPELAALVADLQEEVRQLRLRMNTPPPIAVEGE